MSAANNRSSPTLSEVFTSFRCGCSVWTLGGSISFCVVKLLISIDFIENSCWNGSIADGATSWKWFRGEAPTLTHSETVHRRLWFIKNTPHKLYKSDQSCTGNEEGKCLGRDQLSFYVSDVSYGWKMAKHRQTKWSWRDVLSHTDLAGSGADVAGVLCVPADNYLVPTESSIHSAGTLTGKEEMRSRLSVMLRGLKARWDYSLKYDSYFCECDTIQRILIF